MTFDLISADGKRRLGAVTAPDGPVCGEDFCDRCGDCLACHGGEWCPEGGHFRIVYEDNLEEFLAEHESATVERSGDG